MVFLHSCRRCNSPESPQTELQRRAGGFSEPTALGVGGEGVTFRMKNDGAPKHEE